jgi:hypothetical protein
MRASSRCHLRLIAGVALVALGPLHDAPAYAHGDPFGAGDPDAGFRIVPERSTRVPGLLESSDQAPRVRIVGEIVVIEDDGTMIENGRFVLSRIMPGFYSAAPDSFDLVSVFGASSLPEPMGDYATQVMVRSETAGLGRHTGLNRSGLLGVPTHRLKSIQLMQSIRQYGARPTDRVPIYPVDFTGVELLASEALHMVACWVNLEDGPLGLDLVGRSDAHWSFFFHTQASVMEGCAWRDNGNGTFTTEAVVNGISELDEYLLGLRPAEDVGPMFFIADPDPPRPPGSALVEGFTVRGRRVDFEIDDIIAANGPRVPDAASAPHEFRMAFALVVPRGEAATASDLAFLEQFRLDWEEFFHVETESLGTMVTELPRVPVEAGFRQERFAGNPPLLVEFRDESSGTISHRTWDFGDGSAPAYGPNPIHVYPRPGSYDVTLTVEGIDGSSSVLRREAAVIVGGFTTLARCDFEEAAGWYVDASDDAVGGRWELGDPEGTTNFSAWVQPEHDHSPDGTSCWSTGRSGGRPADHDVDGGTTTLYSPVYDLSGTVFPCVSYARWYTNNHGPNSEEDELLVETSSDGGGAWVRLETLEESDIRWHTVQFRLADFIIPTDEVVFRVLASDLGGLSLVEAAIDDFEILDGLPPAVTASGVQRPSPPLRPVTTFTVSPNPFSSAANIRWEQPASGWVNVVVHDLGGRRVRTLESARRTAGSREIVWDGRDGSGRPVAAGLYFVRIETPAGTAVRSLIRLR